MPPLQIDLKRYVRHHYSTSPTSLIATRSSFQDALRASSQPIKTDNLRLDFYATNKEKQPSTIRTASSTTRASQCHLDIFPLPIVCSRRLSHLFSTVRTASATDVYSHLQPDLNEQSPPSVRSSSPSINPVSPVRSPQFYPFRKIYERDRRRHPSHVCVPSAENVPSGTNQVPQYRDDEGCASANEPDNNVQRRLLYLSLLFIRPNNLRKGVRHQKVGPPGANVAQPSPTSRSLLQHFCNLFLPAPFLATPDKQWLSRYSRNSVNILHVPRRQLDPGTLRRVPHHRPSRTNGDMRPQLG